MVPLKGYCKVSIRIVLKGAFTDSEIFQGPRELSVGSIKGLMGSRVIRVRFRRFGFARGGLDVGIYTDLCQDATSELNL